MNLNTIIQKVTKSPEKIKTDSRSVLPGDIFVAIKGYNEDGHIYTGEALRRGAEFVVCEDASYNATDEEKKKIICVKDSRLSLAEMTKTAFCDPSKKLLTCGVTGTNGKTTTVYLIDSMFSAAGISSGFISTVALKGINGDLEDAVMTTPDVVSINRLLAKMVELKGKAAVIEISSHALSQNRMAGIGLDQAVFTNITPEHLDYHKDMGSYLNDKMKIFNALKDDGIGVLNTDDPASEIILSKKNGLKFKTFGLKGTPDIKAEKIGYVNDRMRFILSSKKCGSTEIFSRVMGVHNVYNIMAAASCMICAGLDLEIAKKGAEEFRGVPGRLQEVLSDAPFRVFVDYAHTPVAIVGLLECLRGLSEKRLICVFGCGGDRDKSKRPIMGKIVSTLADKTVVTSDNSRTESSSDIIKQIREGMKGGKDEIAIEDRGEAIREAFKSATDGDIVVIAGKGHEDYQIIGNERYYFDDTVISKEILKEMGYYPGISG
ncbi:MAG: UDP-N-acetylmuramoyl-L-alanyl-D-glutamate--2,6-diaminopimelate ligase [Candidatus Aadella gelida]|nr:UDP-N-acetylmuramoyl-L-alanyl-D-glutamate--2,6-diaminopimelate ligase [Candidatus Aadella gelida]